MSTPFDSLAGAPKEPEGFGFHAVPDKDDPAILSIEVVVPLHTVKQVASDIGLKDWKYREVQITEKRGMVSFNATWVILHSLVPVLALAVRRELNMPNPKPEDLMHYGK